MEVTHTGIVMPVNAEGSSDNCSLFTYVFIFTGSCIFRRTFACSYTLLIDWSEVLDMT